MNELAIQIHPMVPLAKASAILKINREELIRRLSSGELLGEKRRIGESKKDSWFIYADEFNRLLSQAVAKYEERVSTKGLEQFFSPGSDLPEASLSPQAMARQTAPSTNSKTPLAVAETIAIAPVSVDHRLTDPAEIVDALSTNSVADQTAAMIHDDERATGTGLQVQEAMVAQVVHLLQHLQDERQSGEALKTRLAVLEEEVDQLRREFLRRPDVRSHSPLSRLKTYFRFLLGVST